MPRLSDIQLVLLSAAAQHADGSLLPPPDGAAGPPARIAKTIAALVKRSLASEADVADPARAWRQDGERHVGVFITDAGRAAIGIEPAEVAAASPPPPEAVGDAIAEVASKAITKAARIVALLQRRDGATLNELVAATCWLPHTTRAALTGLRKKGHAIAKSKRGDATCYRIERAA